MKKKEYVINSCDNYFLLLNKDQILCKEFKSLKEDQIININLFIDEFNKFLKENHIRIPLFGWIATFIKNKHLNSVLLEKYQEIFSDYFSKIKIKSIEEILKLENDNSFMNICQNYIDYYYMKKNQVQLVRINPLIFNNNYNKVINHLLTNIYKPEKLIVFGSIENISKTAESINKNLGVSVIFPEKTKEYIVEEYKKLNL